MADKTTWTPDTKATPELLTPLFDDVGLGEESIIMAIRAREATRQYCLRLLTEDTETNMGELNAQACAFYEGYLAGAHSAETAKAPGYLDTVFARAQKAFLVLG